MALISYTGLVAIAMLATGLLISVLSRRTAVATGVALFAWLILVFLSDLGIMAGSILFKFRVQEVFGLAVVNLLQAFKMAVIVDLNASLDVLGPAGVYASHTFGNSLSSLLLAVMLLWIVIPLVLSLIILNRKATL